MTLAQGHTVADKVSPVPLAKVFNSETICPSSTDIITKADKVHKEDTDDASSSLSVEPSDPDTCGPSIIDGDPGVTGREPEITAEAIVPSSTNMIMKADEVHEEDTDDASSSLSVEPSDPDTCGPSIIDGDPDVTGLEPEITAEDDPLPAITELGRISPGLMTGTMADSYIKAENAQESRKTYEASSPNADSAQSGINKTGIITSDTADFTEESLLEQLHKFREKEASIARHRNKRHKRRRLDGPCQTPIDRASAEVTVTVTLCYGDDELCQLETYTEFETYDWNDGTRQWKHKAAGNTEA